MRSEALVVRDRVLNDECLDALRMGERHAKADRTAVVLHIKAVLATTQRPSVKPIITFAGSQERVRERGCGFGASL